MEFRPMRRFKQQLSREDCLAVLAEQPRGVLSVLGDGGYPYGIPMNHWYDPETGSLYFHMAVEGHKLDAIKSCDKVSYCVYDQGAFNPTRRGLDFRCVVVFGRIRVVEDKETALGLIRRLAAKYNPDPNLVEEDIRSAGHRVLCAQLRPEHITGKLVNES